MILRNLALALLIAPAFAYADEPNYTEIMIVEDTNSSDNILELVTLDKQPEFPGGINSLMQFLGENIVYPTECAEHDIQGKVLVKFTVFKNGKVGNIEVVRPVHPLLDAEAVRVVSLLPDWNPGELDGKPVNVWYNLPINFKLQGDDPRMAESDKFVTLGDEALAQNNSDHAFAYYKEAFDILLSRANLIDKCDSLISGNPEKQEAFYKWAVPRLMREAQLNCDVDGLHFWNADSTITINLTCLDRGFAKAEEVRGNGFIEEDIINQIACDNADSRIFNEVSDKGYLKVGLTSDFIPMVEKSVAHFDNDEDMMNEHLHISRSFMLTPSLNKPVTLTSITSCGGLINA